MNILRPNVLTFLIFVELGAWLDRYEALRRLQCFVVVVLLFLANGAVQEKREELSMFSEYLDMLDNNDFSNNHSSKFVVLGLDAAMMIDE